MHFFSGWPNWVWAILASIWLFILVAWGVRIKIGDALTPTWRRAARIRWRRTYWGAWAFLGLVFLVGLFTNLLPGWPLWAWALLILTWPFVARTAANDEAPTGRL